MSIRRGLRYGDQDDQTIKPTSFGTTNFNADRSKTNFESDVDNLLFGGTNPPPRRRKDNQGAGSDTKPAPPTPEVKKPTPPPPEVKKPVPVQPPPVTVISSLIQKPTKPEPKKPEPTPTKKVEPVVEEKPKKQKEVPIEQPKNTKQTDSNETTVNIDNLLSFNRPAYIRKLKKVAEDFNFFQENSSKHRFVQVLRPSETLRSNVRKQNSPEFQDKQFPPNSTSIGFDSKNEKVEWRRPKQVFKAPVFGKYVDPNDIEPGLLSSPQFLSTLSVLAEREENIKRLIENQKVNSNGFYYVRLNINGVWRYIAVDDSLPEQDGKALGARSFNDSESELWVSLIEKAYAKVYHNYGSFKHNSNLPRQHYLRDLTGAPVRKYEVSDPQLTQIINEALGLGFPVLAVPSQKIVDLGFNPNYSLSVIKSSNKGVELRSSFGTIVERPKVNISREGSFQISSSQIRDYVSYILIAETDSNLSTTTIQSKHHGSFYSCYSFKLNNPNPNGTITISQFDRRLFSNKAHYDYAPFRVILEKKDVEDEQTSSLLINASFSYKSRNLDLAVNLNPGTYYIYCIGQWGEYNYDYDLTLYGPDLVQFNKIYHSNFPNIIAEALTQENLSNGKRAAKGNVDEYILYHQPSNLVLITALSLVDRTFNHTLNLQQVKPENLRLLNSVRPEDNFAKKSRIQNRDYKSSVFNQKNWEVSLLPHEKYTWVFSSGQNYDPANFKNWGFK